MRRGCSPSPVGCAQALRCIRTILLFSLPYVLAAGLHISGIRLTLRSRVAYGAMLAMALSIKPHYALLVLFVEACVVLCCAVPVGVASGGDRQPAGDCDRSCTGIALRYPSYSSFIEQAQPTGMPRTWPRCLSTCSPRFPSSR